MIPRRRFLQSCAAAALAWPAGGRSAEPAARPSLGFSLYGMKMLPVEAALRACAEIGYTHVELVLNAGYPTEPAALSAAARKEIRELLGKHRLSVPCLMAHWSLTADEGGQAEALASIAAAGELAHDLVPDAPPIVETVAGGSPARWNEQQAGMADRLGAWADAAEKADIGLALKAHVGSAVNSPERLLALLGEVKSPRLHAVYDFSHFELQGMDLETTMKALLPRTKFIHVKDSRGDAKKFEFLLPGEGRTDYVRYFTLLRRWGYAGPVCVEASGQVFNKPGYDAVAAARQSYAALAPALERAYSG